MQVGISGEQRIAAPGAGKADENAAHLRRLNWALLAIIAGLVVYIIAGH